MYFVHSAGSTAEPEDSQVSSDLEEITPQRDQLRQRGRRSIARAAKIYADQGRAILNDDSPGQLASIFVRQVLAFVVNRDAVVRDHAEHLLAVISASGRSAYSYGRPPADMRGIAMNGTNIPGKQTSNGPRIAVDNCAPASRLYVFGAVFLLGKRPWHMSKS